MPQVVANYGRIQSKVVFFSQCKRIPAPPSSDRKHSLIAESTTARVSRGGWVILRVNEGLIHSPKQQDESIREAHDQSGIAILVEHWVVRV